MLIVLRYGRELDLGLVMMTDWENDGLDNTGKFTALFVHCRKKRARKGKDGSVPAMQSHTGPVSLQSESTKYEGVAKQEEAVGNRFRGAASAVMHQV